MYTLNDAYLQEMDKTELLLSEKENHRLVKDGLEVIGPMHCTGLTMTF